MAKYEHSECKGCPHRLGARCQRFASPPKSGGFIIDASIHCAVRLLNIPICTALASARSGRKLLKTYRYRIALSTATIILSVDENKKCHSKRAKIGVMHPPRAVIRASTGIGLGSGQNGSRPFESNNAVAWFGSFDPKTKLDPFHSEIFKVLEIATPKHRVVYGRHASAQPPFRSLIAAP